MLEEGKPMRLELVEEEGEEEEDWRGRQRQNQVGPCKPCWRVSIYSKSNENLEKKFNWGDSDLCVKNGSREINLEAIKSNTQKSNWWLELGLRSILEAEPAGPIEDCKLGWLVRKGGIKLDQVSPFLGLKSSHLHHQLKPYVYVSVSPIGLNICYLWQWAYLVLFHLWNLRV